MLSQGIASDAKLIQPVMLSVLDLPLRWRKFFFFFKQCLLFKVLLFLCKADRTFMVSVPQSCPPHRNERKSGKREMKKRDATEEINKQKTLGANKPIKVAKVPLDETSVNAESFHLYKTNGAYSETSLPDSSSKLFFKTVCISQLMF